MFIVCCYEEIGTGGGGFPANEVNEVNEEEYNLSLKEVKELLCLKSPLKNGKWGMYKNK